MSSEIRLLALVAAVAGGLAFSRTAIPADPPSQEGAVTLLGAETGDGEAKKNELVTMKAFLAQDRLPAGGTCKVAILVTIQEGWHINTNPPRPETMIPTQFSVKSKHGTTLKEVKYPEGVEITVKGLKEPQTIYEKQVLLRGVLTAPKDSAGQTEELELQVRYQACNEEICHPPKTIKLSGRLPIASPGEPVNSINAKYFPAEK